jgi:cytochrome c biogenesis protein CcmG/thiol:disulfide interchange protein DsbE
MMGGQSYPSLHDDRKGTGIDYGVYGAPETFIIDQNGVVAHKFIGAVTLMELREQIDPLLANVESESVVSEIERGS